MSLPLTFVADGSMEAAEKCRAVAELAQRLGNVSEACRRLGVPRHAYYAWSKAQDESNGTLDRPRKRHPQALSPDLQEQILALARENPDWGCDRIAYYLKLNGKAASSPTVQKLLVRNGLGRRSQRLLKGPRTS